MASRDIDFNILISILIVAAVVLSWLIGGSVIGDVIDKKPDGGSDDLMINKSSSTSTTSTTSSPIIKQVVTTSTSISTTTSTSTSTTVAPECFLNSDCGVNGVKITQDYSCYDGDIYRQYIHYRCSNPGTSSAKCVGREEIELIKKCRVNEHCIDGEPYCEYLGDVDGSVASTRPSGSTLLDISNKYNNSYSNYLLGIAYIISKESEPRGVAIDIWKSDENRTRIYCHGKGVRVDDLVIGLVDISKWGPGIWVNIWIQETDGF
ncbi:MAG: hypothetical protein U9Q22_07530 [Candidatus Altiarchaeota archaeon]|nr:hypothetical protein [Candidatus Altiarchaeota archaeon]